MTLMIVLIISENITIIDVIIFFFASYFSNKILILIGKYFKCREEKKNLESVIKRIESKYVTNISS